MVEAATFASAACSCHNGEAAPASAGNRRGLNVHVDALSDVLAGHLDENSNFVTPPFADEIVRWR